MPLIIQKKVLCSAQKRSVIWAEPHSRSSAKNSSAEPNVRSVTTLHSMLSGKRVVRNVHKCHVTHDCKSGAYSHCRKSLAIPPFHFCNCCWVGFFSMTKINVLYVFGQCTLQSRVAKSKNCYWVAFFL